MSAADFSAGSRLSPGDKIWSGRLALPVTIFLIGLIIPLIIQAGPLRLSVYRVILVFMFIPLFGAWLSGRAGPKSVADFSVVVICIWTTLSNIVIDGVEVALEPSGIAVIETFGSYLLARVMVRNPEQFYQVAKTLFILVLVLLPFALFETVTSINITLKIFGAIGNVYEDIPKEPRWGFDRVQASFDHPILFGVFCSSALALAFYVLGANSRFFGRAMRSGIVFSTGALSWSSGPLSAMVANISLIAWDQVFWRSRRRWIILLSLFAFAYIVVDIISNRTPVEVFISYLSFNPQTAYSRILIWEWGTKSIFNYPLFGLGLYRDWERLYFMTPSVDMFWILPAMRSGIPVWIAYFVFFFSIFFSVVRRKAQTPLMENYKKGYLICIFSLFVAGWTVHYWNATFALFMFLMGCGRWFIDYRPSPGDGQGNGGEDELHGQRGRNVAYKAGPILPPGYESQQNPDITKSK